MEAPRSRKGWAAVAAFPPETFELDAAGVPAGEEDKEEECAPLPRERGARSAASSACRAARRRRDRSDSWTIKAAAGLGK